MSRPSQSLTFQASTTQIIAVTSWIVHHMFKYQLLFRCVLEHWNSTGSGPGLCSAISMESAPKPGANPSFNPSTSPSSIVLCMLKCFVPDLTRYLNRNTCLGASSEDNWSTGIQMRESSKGRESNGRGSESPRFPRICPIRDFIHRDKDGMDESARWFRGRRAARSLTFLFPRHLLFSLFLLALLHLPPLVFLIKY